MLSNKYRNKIYAGVLGKTIGVYLGRPVEGWTYEKIAKEFGEINYYVNHRTGAPLIVPDDDISGTFVFYRALEDNGFDEQISAKQIGDTWLNYIIEDQTILWWGGLSRSTEHTAYLRLKNGIQAPMSGSMELNGRSMAEQIGSQIFIDTWALVNPGNPGRTAEMARKAASVSHDGIAISAAVYLAVMESLAFEEKDMNKLLDRGLEYIDDERLSSLVKDIRHVCSSTDDWHQVRQWIAEHHSYDKYPGNCPMVTNHLVVLMALIMGGDDFQKSCSIASSAGWDTDCNSGNVGCLNGIRLGLEGFESGPDLRKAVADRMYIISADGGSCVSDAVIETRKLIQAAEALQGQTEPAGKPRFAFEYPGSVQGFMAYERFSEEQTLTEIENAYDKTGESGLLLSYENLAKGMAASACVDVFVDLKPKGVDGTSYFDVLCSPSLYSGQEVTAVMRGMDAAYPEVRFFIEYFNECDELELMYSDSYTMAAGDNTFVYQIPDTKGHAIYRFGIAFTSDSRISGSVLLRSLDWSNTPVRFEMGGSMEMTPSLTPWTTNTSWLKTFMSSALNLCPDYTTTFSVSHPGENGVVTTGTTDWSDYSVASAITFSQQDCAGLVARAKGHRRYYAAGIRDSKAVIFKRKDEEIVILAEADYDYQVDMTAHLEFKLDGSMLALYIDGEKTVMCKDEAYINGGAGFLVESGAILADRFVICRL